MKKLLVIVFLASTLGINAQRLVQYRNAMDSILIKTELIKTDSVAFVNSLRDWQQQRFSDGYLYCRYSIDKSTTGDTLIVYEYLGPKVFVSSIMLGNTEENVMRSIGWSERKMNKLKHPDPAIILMWEKKMVTWYENNGFPFASVSFEIDAMLHDTVQASWNITKGPSIVFDSIIQKGSYKPGSAFISAWLDIEPGKPYDESKLERARQRIEMSDLAQEEKPMQLHFSEGKARVYFYLRRKKSNRFDGILGFAPDAAQPGKIQFNGDVNLKLANSFNHGDVIALKWKSSASRSQEISFKAGVPYLLGLPVGIEAAIDIYRRDTLYVRTKQHYGLSYYSGIATKIEFFAENTENRVIDQSIFESATLLPQWADSRTTSGGIGIYWPKVDNLILPTKGFLFETELAAGKKTIIKNSTASDSLYNGVTMESVVFNTTSQIFFFQPVKGSFKLMGAARFGLLESESLFENDLFLLGGLNLLRGFDEKSIPASAYCVSTIETRFFIEKYSYLLLFADYGAVRQMSNNVFRSQYYLSIGTGMSFSTNAGIFNIFYALGKSNPGSFTLRNGKIHFGFVTRF